MSRFSAQLKGMQEAQRGIARTSSTLKGDGISTTTRDVTVKLQRFMTSITPAVTGSWRSAHRVETQGSRLRIYIDPQARNPRSGGRPAEYGAILEEKRGGRYAVYRKTYQEMGERYAQEGIDDLKARLP